MTEPFQVCLGLVLIAATNPGWTCSSVGICPHGSGGPAFGDIVLPDFREFFHWIWHQCNAQGLRISENLSHKIKIFVRVGEKQRMCRRPSDFKLKRISSLFFSNLEAVGHYHLIHWWRVGHIISADLPRVRWKPRCFCYVSVQFAILLPVDVSSFVFLVRVLCSRSFCFSLSSFLFACLPRGVMSGDKPFAKCKTTRPDAMSSLELWIFLGYICSNFQRFESPV